MKNNKRLKNLFLVFLIILTNSCSLTKRSSPICKNYYSKNDVNNHKITFTMCSDNTFLYNHNSESGKEYLSKGTWKNKDGGIYINSYATEKYDVFPSFKYLRRKKKSDSLEIECTNFLGERLDIYIILLKHNEKENKAIEEYHYISTDSNFVVSKKDYIAMMLPYELNSTQDRDYSLPFNDSLIYKVKINTEFSVVSLDRIIQKISFNNLRIEPNKTTLILNSDTLYSNN